MFILLGCSSVWIRCSKNSIHDQDPVLIHIRIRLSIKKIPYGFQKATLCGVATQNSLYANHNTAFYQQLVQIRIQSKKMTFTTKSA